MGLVNLNYFNACFKRRENLFSIYDESLSKIGSIKIIKSSNYSYLPVVLETEELLLKIKTHLQENDIETRRYFKPSLDKLNFFEAKEKCPISNKVADNILCLPIYDSIKESELIKTIEIIDKVINVK